MNSKLLFVLAAILLIIRNMSPQSILSPEAIYERVSPSVVVILAYDFNNKLKSKGSGVVIDKEGYIVTNYHVFADCERLEIKHEDLIISDVEIVGADVEKDILIVKNKKGLLLSVKKADSNRLKVGQRIYAIGSPLGLENSMSEGIIAGIRNVSELNRSYIQITASISSGSSGGAIVNDRGELIGISTFTDTRGQNLNFAIPISDINSVKLLEQDDTIHLRALNYFYKGYNSLISREFKKAIDFFKQCLEIKPFPNVYNNLGCAYQGIENHDEAIKYFELAIHFDFNYTDAYFNLARTYSALGKYRDAIMNYENALRIDPNFASALYNIGYIFETLKDFLKAEEYYHQTLAVKDDHEKALGGLAGIYAQRGEYDKSIQFFEQAININPTIPELQFNLATIYYLENDYDKAIKTLETAIELNPHYIDAYLKLSGIYMKVGDYVSAVNYTKIAARLGSKEAQQILIKLNETW